LAFECSSVPGGRLSLSALRMKARLRFAHLKTHPGLSALIRCARCIHFVATVQNLKAYDVAVAGLTGSPIGHWHPAG
jgi:hypothetical protein